MSHVSSPSLIGISVTLLVLSLLAVVLRFRVRLKHNKSLKVDDVMALVALVRSIRFHLLRTTR